MGVLAVGLGKVETALPFFKTAIGANPDVAQYWLSYINALIQLERLAEAKAVFDQAKSNGAAGEGFDQLEKRLASSPSTTSAHSRQYAGSLPELIDTFYTKLNDDILKKAAGGWFYNIKFDQEFLGQDIVNINLNTETKALKPSNISKNMASAKSIQHI